MNIITTDSSHYSSIASAIRQKLHSDNTYLPGEMASAIGQIVVGSNTLKMLIDVTGNAYQMFLGCADVSFLAYPNGYSITGNAKDMSGALALTRISRFKEETGATYIDLSSAVYMDEMFYSCERLEEVELPNLPSVQTLSYLFRDCSVLTTATINGLPREGCTSLSGMFANCERLSSVTINNNATAYIKNMSNMFYGCLCIVNSENLPDFPTSLVENMSGMFAECVYLEETPILNCQRVTNFTGMFSGCASLKKINLRNISSSIDISASTAYETNDLLSVMQHLNEVTVTQTLTMGLSNLQKLTPEQIATATAKNWSVA